MKKSMMIAMSALALVGCQTDEVLDSHSGSEQSANTAIRFDGGAGKMSRALKNGKDAADLLNNNFVVYGYKTTTGTDGTSNTSVVVYDHYNVNYKESSAGQTTSNTKGWEYVGQNKNSLSSSTSQTIKYWDYSALQYDFIAFSFGKATQGAGEDNVEASSVTTENGPTYTLKGSAENLAKCYIADRVTAKNGNTNTDLTEKNQKLYKYGNTISFNFRSLATKVRMGIFEIVPGYAIKDVVFYSDEDNTLTGDANKPTLFNNNKDGNKKTIASGKGKMTVFFEENDATKTDFNQAKVSWEGEEENATFINLPTLAMASSKEGSETSEADNYLPRTSTDAIKNVEYKTVLAGTTVGNLTLKVDYTLESIDGSGETIKVTGATAVIPSQYTNWQPNYAYTYIFKISDKTNGTTGGGEDPEGLYPITFDAVVTETEDGLQETITKVEIPSITTYAKGAVNNEYKKDQNIYVSVENKELSHEQTNADESEQQKETVQDIKLYTAKTQGTSYTVTEANVALALTKTDNKLGDDDNNLTVTEASGLTIVEQIDAADAPDGNAISGNFATFTPSEAGTYVVEFTDYKTNDKYYKVITVTE